MSPPKPEAAATEGLREFENWLRERMPNERTLMRHQDATLAVWVTGDMERLESIRHQLQELSERWVKRIFGPQVPWRRMPIAIAECPRDAQSPARLLQEAKSRFPRADEEHGFNGS